MDELFEALSKNKTMTAEEKRLEVFEILEPELRRYWKKYKYNQGMIVRILSVLMDIEYFTTDLMLKLYKGLFRNNGPAMIDRLVMLYEKMNNLNGRLIRPKTPRRLIKSHIKKDPKENPIEA